MNVLSLLSHTPPMAGYSASKAPVHSLTQELRPVLAAQRISVHGVNPGGIDTDMLAGVDAPKTPLSAVAAKRCIVAGHHSASACRRSSEPDRSEACGGRLLEG